MMKTSVIKKTCVLLAAIIATTCLAACKKNNDSTTVTPPPKKDETIIVDTDKYIVKDKSSEYSVLLPENADYNLLLAADETVNAFKEACGYELNVTDEYAANGKYISIGNTELYVENKTSVIEGELSYTEIAVKTVGDNVFINGNTTEDAVYATYEFLEVTVGFKVYTLDDIYIRKSENVKLYNITLREKPDISVRSLRYSRIYNSSNKEAERLNHRRMRADFTDDAWFSSGHNQASVILPKTTYYKDHNDWYSTTVETNSDPDVGQLCLTNEEMQAEFIKNVKEMIQNDADFYSRKFFMLGMQDNWSYCKCARCSEKARANGGSENSRACLEIMFANAVEKAINDDWDWLKDNHPGAQIQFVIFGYFYNAAAPVKYNEQGNPIPYNDNVICDEHVSVLFAPLTGNFAYSIADDRSKIGKQVNEWSAVCTNFMYYSYCAQFAALPVPTNDLITLAGNVSTLVKNGGYYMQDQGATLTNTSGMEELAWYVRSNFMWDSSKSVDEYAYEFIDYYYMPVAESFKKYYNAFRSFQVYQVEKLNLMMGMQDFTYISEKNWPKGYLDSFNDMLDAMIADLEPFKTSDPAVYEKYFDRLNKEKIWIYYLYCENYKRYFNEKDYNELVEFMRTYCAKYSVNEYREYVSITEKIDGWLS